MPHAYWFGEDQARYIVTVPAQEAGLVLAKMKGAGVSCARIGTTGGDCYRDCRRGAGYDRYAQGGIRGLASGLYERHRNRLSRIVYSTCVAPGIFRNASRYAAQLKMTVSTKAIAALTIAGRS